MKTKQCVLCFNQMTAFTSNDNQTIYMCPCCQSLYIPCDISNMLVNDYDYDRHGWLTTKGRTIPTHEQMSYLQFLVSELNIQVDFRSMTKRKAQKLIAELKIQYEEKYNNEHTCVVNGTRIEIIKPNNATTSCWLRGFADAEITDRQWLENYKNNLHPNDDWTNVNLETYCRWLYKINDKERDVLIDEALKAHVVGFLE